MGVSAKYLAFHWRSEKSNCDYEACGKLLAKNILKAAGHVQSLGLLLDKVSPSCVLVTDIPMHGTHGAWGPFKRNEMNQPSRVRAMQAALTVRRLF